MKKADPGLCECMGSPKPFLTLFFFFAWSWMTWSCEICPRKLSFQCCTAVASGQDLGLFLRCKQFMSVQTEVFWEGMKGSLEHIHIQWKGGGVFRFSVKREGCCLVLLPAPHIQTMTQIHETGYGVEKRWNFHMKRVTRMLWVLLMLPYSQQLCIFIPLKTQLSTQLWGD